MADDPYAREFPRRQCAESAARAHDSSPVRDAASSRGEPLRATTPILSLPAHRTVHVLPYPILGSVAFVRAAAELCFLQPRQYQRNCRYAKCHETPRDKLLYHTAVMVERDSAAPCTLFELAWWGGLGGYGGATDAVQMLTLCSSCSVDRLAWCVALRRARTGCGTRMGSHGVWH